MFILHAYMASAESLKIMFLRRYEDWGPNSYIIFLYFRRSSFQNHRRKFYKNYQNLTFFFQLI